MRRIEGTKGTCGFSVYTLYKLALALDVSLDKLIEESTEEKIRQ